MQACGTNYSEIISRILCLHNPRALVRTPKRPVNKLFYEKRRQLTPFPQTRLLSSTNSPRSSKIRKPRHVEKVAKMSWMDSWSRPTKSQATPAPYYLLPGGESTPYCKTCGRVISKSLTVLVQLRLPSDDADGIKVHGKRTQARTRRQQSTAQVGAKVASQEHSTAALKMPLLRCSRVRSSPHQKMKS
jgi:hypothetical protein